MLKKNSEYTNKNFNKETDEGILINDYDANNLYGHAMCEKLSLHSYSRVNDISTIDEEFIINYNDDSDFSYIIEGDIKNRKILHDLHFHLPFPCIQDTVFKTKKLLHTLEDNYNYVVYMKMLKLALSDGLKLIKVNRVKKFYQSSWLKPYIALNTQLRIKADKNGDSFGVGFYKLIINSVFKKLWKIKENTEILGLSRIVKC